MQRVMVLVDQLRRAGYRFIGQLLGARRYCDICDRPITGQPLRGNSPDEAVCEHCWETIAWIRGPLRADRFLFVDRATDREVVLCLDGAPGVEHPGCAIRADVVAELDAFFCRSCGWNGRISGAWFVDVSTERSA